MERYIAVDNVCAWPNVTRLGDGVLVAIIFNQPCHGLWEGDVECWTSHDGGRLWEYASAVAPHHPRTARLNHAAGITTDGSLVAVVSGFSKPSRGHKARKRPQKTLNPWVCRSYDGGKTWQNTDAAILLQSDHGLIPFGDIGIADDGSLRMSVYSYNPAGDQASAYCVSSYDAGMTWGNPALIADSDYNETDLLRVYGSTWLAASRTATEQNLEVFNSQDSGKTWHSLGPATLAGQHPGHLLMLSDGRILLTYGLRNRGMAGVGGRISDDEGLSWGAPFLLVDLKTSTDHGYPSSVQLEDGTIVTAYYANTIPTHNRYHMGIVRWRLGEIEA